ncbi:MAG: sigma-54 dependent transcriptional regulator [Desulfohalobiaceae bacterium]|nr:sigma-54 dependent transcriptional regulator [Desulfohalobiaceae bacterium]
MDAETRILVLDDEKDFAIGLSRVLKAAFSNHVCSYVTSPSECFNILRKQETAVLLTDLRMPGMDGLQVLAKALELQPLINVIVLTAYGSIERAVEALKNGAYDFLTKPLDHDHLFCQVQKALERHHLVTENERLRQKAQAGREYSLIIGESQAMLKLKQALAMVAQNDYTVLIQGESGTGKELAARVIHDLSSRAGQKLVMVNCPAIPDHLLESELFGHTKGAFTGADHNREGLFKEADTGTILLDEIGDISLSIQIKLLRVLQDQEIRPVGSNQSQRVNVRILATTNQDLSAKIHNGTFREDLYYRLNVLNIHVPPLRERKEDIPLLVHSLVHSVCQEMGIEPKTVTSGAMSSLAAREWPGNVRELLNFVRRMVVFCPGQAIDLEKIRFVEKGNLVGDSEEGLQPYKEAKARVLEDFTLTYIQDVLSRTQGNISQAARLSGLERVSLQKIMRRFNIQV